MSRAAVLLLLASLLTPAGAAAENRWAVIVSGASGGPKYAEQMQQWRTALQAALVSRYGFEESRVHLLVDESVKDGTTGSAANVR